MTAYDVTAFGESMLRLSVPVGERLARAGSFDAYVGGAESNVLGALAQLGRRCSWFSALPSNALGELVAQHFRAVGIDLAGVVWQSQGRLGTYFIEHATPPRSAQVIYDRAGSCVAQLTSGQVDWSRLLDTRLLHLTGITPALSPSCRGIVAEAISRARAAGVPFSFDINYRARLWPEEEAAPILGALAGGAALLFCSQTDAWRLFGIAGGPEEVAGALAGRFGADCVVVSAADAGVVVWEGGATGPVDCRPPAGRSPLLRQPAYPVMTVDRLGAGDALAAGVIHGWLDGDLARGVRYGVLLAALALTQHGDMVVTNQKELDALLAVGGGGIQR